MLYNDRGASFDTACTAGVEIRCALLDEIKCTGESKHAMPMLPRRKSLTVVCDLARAERPVLFIKPLPAFHAGCRSPSYRA